MTSVNPFYMLYTPYILYMYMYIHITTHYNRFFDDFTEKSVDLGSGSFFGARRGEGHISPMREKKFGIFSSDNRVWISANDSACLQHEVVALFFPLAIS